MMLQDLKTLIDNGQGVKAASKPEYIIDSGVCPNEFEAKKRFKQALAKEGIISKPGKVLWTDYPILERKYGKCRITARFNVRTTD